MRGQGNYKDRTQIETKITNGVKNENKNKRGGERELEKMETEDKKGIGLCSDNQSRLVLSDGHYLCQLRAASTKRLPASLKIPRHGYKFLQIMKMCRKTQADWDVFVKVIRLAAKLWKKKKNVCKTWQRAEYVSRINCVFYLLHTKLIVILAISAVWWHCTVQLHRLCGIFCHVVVMLVQKWNQLTFP